MNLGIAFGFLGLVAGVLAFWRTSQLNALDGVVVTADVYVGVVLRHREWLLRVVAPVIGLLVSVRGWAYRKEVRDGFSGRVPLRLLGISWVMIAVGVALTFARGSGLPNSDGWFGFPPGAGFTYTPQSKDPLTSSLWIWGGRFVVAGVVVLLAALCADGIARRRRLSVALALVVASLFVARGSWDRSALNPYVYLFIGLSSGAAAVCLHMTHLVSSREK